MYWVSLRSQQDVVQVNIYLFVGSRRGITVGRNGLCALCYAFLTGKKNKVVVKWSDSE